MYITYAHTYTASQTDTDTCTDRQTHACMHTRTHTHTHTTFNHAYIIGTISNSQCYSFFVFFNQIHNKFLSKPIYSSCTQRRFYHTFCSGVTLQQITALHLLAVSSSCVSFSFNSACCYGNQTNSDHGIGLSFNTHTHQTMTIKNYGKFWSFLMLSILLCFTELS